MGSVPPSAAPTACPHLQRRRTVVGVHDVARLLVQVRHPRGKLGRVGERGRQEHHFSLVRQKDDGLLPHNAALA
eukprot:202807-Chlamydomonas_euryale.AAC.1